MVRSSSRACLSITLVCWFQSFCCYILRSTWFFVTQFLLTSDTIWTPEVFTLAQVLLAVLGSVYLLILLNVPMVYHWLSRTKPNDSNHSVGKANTSKIKIKLLSLCLSHLFLLSVCIGMVSQKTQSSSTNSLSMVLLCFVLGLTINWSLLLWRVPSVFSLHSLWTLAMQDLCLGISSLLFVSTIVIFSFPFFTNDWSQLIHVSLNLWPVTLWTSMLALFGFLPPSSSNCRNSPRLSWCFSKSQRQENDSDYVDSVVVLSEKANRTRKIEHQHLRFKRWILYPLTFLTLVVIQRKKLEPELLLPPLTSLPSPNLLTSIDQCGQSIARYKKDERAEINRRLIQHRSCISGAINVLLSDPIQNLLSFYATLDIKTDQAVEFDDLVSILNQIVAFLVDVSIRDHAFICQQMHRHIQPCLVKIATGLEEWIQQDNKSLQDQAPGNRYCAQMLKNVQMETGEPLSPLISRLSNLMTNVQCSTRESWQENNNEIVPCSYVWIQSLLSTIVNAGQSIAAMSLDDIGGQLKKIVEIPSTGACAAYSGQLYHNTRNQRMFLNLDRPVDSCIRPLDTSIQYIRAMPWVMGNGTTTFQYERLFQLEQCLTVKAIGDEYDIEFPREVFPADMCLHVPNSFSDDCALFLYEWMPVTDDTYSFITGMTLLDQFFWTMVVWLFILFTLWGIAMVIHGAQKLYQSLR